MESIPVQLTRKSDRLTVDGPKHHSLIEHNAVADPAVVCRTCAFGTGNRLQRYTMPEITELMGSGVALDEFKCRPDRAVTVTKVTLSGKLADLMDETDERTHALVDSCGWKGLRKCLRCTRFIAERVEYSHVAYPGATPRPRKVIVGGYCSIPPEGIVVRGKVTTCDYHFRPWDVTPSCANCEFNWHLGVGQMIDEFDRTPVKTDLDPWEDWQAAVDAAEMGEPAWKIRNARRTTRLARPRGMLVTYLAHIHGVRYHPGVTVTGAFGETIAIDELPWRDVYADVAPHLIKEYLLEFPGSGWKDWVPARNDDETIVVRPTVRRYRAAVQILLGTHLERQFRLSIHNAASLPVFDLDRTVVLDAARWRCQHAEHYRNRIAEEARLGGHLPLGDYVSPPEFTRTCTWCLQALVTLRDSEPMATEAVAHYPPNEWFAEPHRCPACHPVLGACYFHRRGVTTPLYELFVAGCRDCSRERGACAYHAKAARRAFPPRQASMATSGTSVFSDADPLDALVALGAEERRIATQLFVTTEADGQRIVVDAEHHQPSPQHFHRQLQHLLVNSDEADFGAIWKSYDAVMRGTRRRSYRYPVGYPAPLLGTEPFKSHCSLALGRELPRYNPTTGTASTIVIAPGGRVEYARDEAGNLTDTVKARSGLDFRKIFGDSFGRMRGDDHDVDERSSRRFTSGPFRGQYVDNRMGRRQPKWAELDAISEHIRGYNDNERLTEENLTNEILALDGWGDPMEWAADYVPGRTGLDVEGERASKKFTAIEQSHAAMLLGEDNTPAHLAAVAEAFRHGRTLDEAVAHVLGGVVVTLPDPTQHYTDRIRARVCPSCERHFEAANTCPDCHWALLGLTETRRLDTRSLPIENWEVEYTTAKDRAGYVEWLDTVVEIDMIHEGIETEAGIERHDRTMFVTNRWLAHAYEMYKGGTRGAPDQANIYSMAHHLRQGNEETFEVIEGWHCPVCEQVFGPEELGMGDDGFEVTCPSCDDDVAMLWMEDDEARAHPDPSRLRTIPLTTPGRRGIGSAIAPDRESFQQRMREGEIYCDSWVLKGTDPKRPVTLATISRRSNTPPKG